MGKGAAGRIFKTFSAPAQKRIADAYGLIYTQETTYENLIILAELLKQLAED